MSRKLTSQESAGPTLEHLEYTPLTPGQKFGEFFADHWKLIAILALAVIGAIVGFAQLTKEPVPDVKVLFLSSSYVLPEKTAEKLEGLLVPYTPDANKDSAQYAKVYSCYFDKGNTGSNPKETALAAQLLADDTCYVIFADPDAYAWLAENGYVSKLGDFITNRPDIEPDALGFKISDSNIFGYVNNGTFAFAGDDFGLSNAFADYQVIFKTGAYNELTGDSLTALQSSVVFYKGVAATVFTSSSSGSALSETSFVIGVD
ncbi:MAG TPA: hypothetical protein PK854_02900 [Oscillospiraceae bacterium]|nr:hypothetical protein [Oscillospiraceae bacterium]